MDVYGNYSNEFEAAYDLSRRELHLIPDDSVRIREAIEAGLSVVVHFVSQYCVFTDASLGMKKYLVSSHETYEAALAALPKQDEGFGGDDDYYEIQPRPVQGFVVPEFQPADDGDEIPF